MSIVNYKKLIAAAVGIAALMLNRYTSVNLMGAENYIVEIALVGLTLIGVERLENKK
jgi:hypothetical protein